MTLGNPYANRRFMRAFDKLWSRFEGLINRFTKSDFNPFYHLGTLTVYFLIILIVTGTYLTIFYRPGSDVAYATVEKISSNWLGSLMRGVHRYASDGMIVLIILHFLKMMFGDRFWGSRWLAWTSGWIMLAVTWLTGTMGYWLIWDQRAQWMTEYMMNTVAGSEGLTYISPSLASNTFSNFVIILFLHVFLPLIGFLGIYIHVLRLSRAQWWSPRWVSIQATIGLILLAVIKPVSSTLPADLSTMVSSTPMDAYYLGFLPLIDQMGNWIFWGLAIFVGGGFFLLPWLASGRDLGPALVTDSKCTGCVLCFNECPYDAIRMNQRNDDSGYHKLAIINNAQCTGCGICVGACPTDAIDLKGGYNGNQTFSAVRGALRREKETGQPVTVLFVSQRNEALDGLPKSLLAEKNNSPVSASSWGSSRVITAVLPSESAVNIEWIKTLHHEGARDVVILSHPYDDSLYREDTHWISSRLRLRPALLTSDIHLLEITPGDSKAVSKFLDEINLPEYQSNKKPPVLPETKDRGKKAPSFVSSLVSVILLTLLFATALPLDIPAGMSTAQESALRIAIDMKGKISAPRIPEGVVLPEGADAAKIFGGERFPVSVRVTADGKTIFEETYTPSGLSGEGRISNLEYLPIDSGSHQIEILLKDDQREFRTVYSGQVTIEKAHVLLFTYDERSDTFSIR